MSTRKILVTGATGKQGGAVVEALLAKPPPYDFQILALTRKITSSAAKALAAKQKVTLVEGDLGDPGSIFTKAGGVGSVYAVFCVTLPSLKKNTENEETRQGNNLIGAAIAHDVKHFVYSSVDRGGPTQSDYQTEKHLQEKSLSCGMTYTILRPVAFMENLTPNFGGRMFATMWKSMGTKKLQIISTHDIGVFAAQAISSPETDDYRNTAISLAGDELTQAEANEVFWKVLGRPMPLTYGLLGTLLQKAIPELGIMFNWFVNHGYGADVAQGRLLNSELLDFEAWLRVKSGFKR
ncbi:uncharacterized protein A1O9_10633 [Exophiala aquamarina CBS 119918]|uniref:NmrA-like domain-containing protein n=1 Tax=Exophiala aquamarina CBS 119918 TaxID=1182545 RepID=A0A072PC88_9EURO|nr:uncharacterized protein A1O9_10633 [Exophiala aquamarina CBS 119918]KEF53185.1 hypothetical protein A1O9_10633 [Exophiala aquamarina CBS 119918]